ncbi:F-box/kelch-repeat protein At3g06240 [Manihot esculenta]|uniref:F-box/kelch-repeat protein At3g06240 n=1 Tax=Manihot esculenta TaxID=3983 RepID=UPI001CC514EB|nr:F-box/kelch-repeat protein At3g06240 [Manihot esculenta]
MVIVEESEPKVKKDKNAENRKIIFKRAEQNSKEYKIKLFCLGLSSTKPISTMAVDYFPKHLVFNILFKLPVRSVVRFRFEYLAFSFLCNDTFDMSPPQEIPYPHDIMEKCSFVDIVGSCCNGVICLRDGYFFGYLLGLWDDVYNYESNIVLWNPTTSETKILPQSNLSHPPSESFSLEIVEFGFDSTTCDYKVLRIFEYLTHDNQCDYLAEIYSLRDDTWRKLDVSLNSWELPSYKFENGDSEYNYDHRAHTGANGTFHWCAKERDHSRDLIVSFDLSNEVIKTTALPDAFSSRYFWRTILCLNEHVVLSLSTNRHVELWVLLEYGVEESWTKLFTVAHPEYLEMALPLGFSRKGELFFSSWSQHLLVWNPPEETISPVPVEGAVHTSNHLQAVPYMESHTSLKGCNKLEDEQNSGDAAQC